MGMSWQDKHKNGLKVLGLTSNATVEQIIDNINTQTNTPGKLHASFPTADAWLNFESSLISNADGSKKSFNPLNGLVPSIPSGSRINFQTKVMEGSTFDNTWPTTNTVGQYYIAGFSLLATGTIKVLWSPMLANTTLVNAFNVASLFVSSAVSLGYVTLEITSGSGAYKTIGSATNIVENPSIFNFSTGGSGGSGNGDASAFESQVELRVLNSPFSLVVPIEFSKAEQTKSDPVDTSATYDFVEKSYKFNTSYTKVVSIDLLDSDFQNTEDDLGIVELWSEWSNAGENTEQKLIVNSETGNPPGVTSTIETFGNRCIFQTRVDDLNQSLVANFINQLGSGSPIEFTSTIKEIGLTSFTLTKKGKVGLTLINIVKTGSPVGSFRVKIYNFDGSNIGDLKYTGEWNTISTISTGDVGFGTNKTLKAGSYVASIEVDSSYIYSVGVTAFALGATLATGTYYTYNGSTWTTLTDKIVRVRVSGFYYSLKAYFRTTDSVEKFLYRFAIFYGYSYPENTTNDEGARYLQRFYTTGNAGITQFTLTRFKPSPDFLEVHVQDTVDNTQMVLRWPGFEVIGNTVKFPVGTFDTGDSNQLIVTFKQDAERKTVVEEATNMIAENHLGSQDPSMDRSLAGRGVLLKDESGNLREVTISTEGGFKILDASGLPYSGITPQFKNGLMNPYFAISQRADYQAYGASQSWDTNLAVGSFRHFDRWVVFRDSLVAGAYVSYSTHIYGARTAYVGRFTGNSATNNIFLGQALTFEDSIRYKGKTVTFSGLFRKPGNDFSALGSILKIQILWQFGGAHVTVTSGFTDYVETSNVLTTSFQKFSISANIPASATQVGIRIYYTPTGTAAASGDRFEVRDAILHEGNVALDIKNSDYDYAREYQKCLYFYEHSGLGFPEAVQLQGQGVATFGGASVVLTGVSYKTKKRLLTPFFKYIHPSTFAFDSVYTIVNAATVAVTGYNHVGSNSILYASGAFNQGYGYWANYHVDADL